MTDQLSRVTLWVAPGAPLTGRGRYAIENGEDVTIKDLTPAVMTPCPCGNTWNLHNWVMAVSSTIDVLDCSVREAFRCPTR